MVHNECIKNEFDPIENADEVVKYYSNGSVNDAFHQNSGVHKGKYIAKDLTTHVHSCKSRYKLLKKVNGKKLELIGDLDEYGNKITSKHSSNVGGKYEFFKNLK